LSVTISPCLTCAKMIINNGIAEVVYGGDYAFTEQTRKLLAEAGVACRKYVPGPLARESAATPPRA
jgi:deoxycytidylate deaminase